MIQLGQPALRRGALAACAGADPDGGGADGADSDMGPGSVDLSDLRRRYSGRLRHSLLLTLLAALVVLGLAFLLLVLLMYPHDFAQDLRRFVVLSAALLAALAVLVLLALVPAEALLRRWALPLGLLGWLLLAGPTLAWTVAKEHISLVDPLAPAFVAAFLLHVLLPLKQLASLLMGPVTSAGLLATTALLADWDTRHFGYQVAAASLFLAMATAVGWYHRHMRDAAQSRSFASTQECIEARIKLEYEKEQQEQLLLSVIPAYIAAEVKRRIMLKMADACQTSTKRSRQRFHELYVQRHNNVRCVPCLSTETVESYVARLSGILCLSKTYLFTLIANKYPLLNFMKLCEA
ncbi:hypothetical protein MRX96_027432 [Rhipicephalus microplus]